MPTLKEYIEQVALRLGSAGSRATDSSPIVYAWDVDSGSGDYNRDITVPSDGLLFAFLQASGDVAGATPGVSLQFRQGKRVAMRTTDGGLFVPVKKGDTVRVSCYNVGAISQRLITFYRTVGGA